MSATDKIRFRMFWRDRKPIVEVWVDNKGWMPASSQDITHQEFDMGDKEQLDIPEKEGK